MLERLLRRGAAPGWLAVELDADRVRLAHVVANGGQPVVEFAEEREWDPAEPKSLERAAREFGVKRFRCTTILKPQEYHILLVEAPAVKPEELKAAVRWRIKDMLDYHVDDATVDLLAVPPNPAGGERAQSMYAVAARNEVIQACIGRFDAARIPLTVIDIPETSQRNVAALFERDERGLAMLYLGREQGLLTINFRRELMLARRIEVGAQELVAASGAAREELFQRVLLELQRTFDHFDRQFAYVPITKLMLAPDAEETGLLEYLAANLDVPVERARLSAAIDFGSGAELEPEQEWRLFHLIGAALRHESKAL